MTKPGTPSPTTATPWPTSSPTLPGRSAPIMPKLDADQQAEHERRRSTSSSVTGAPGRSASRRAAARTARRRGCRVKIASSHEKNCCTAGWPTPVEVVERLGCAGLEQACAHAERRRDALPGRSRRITNTTIADPAQRHERADQPRAISCSNPWLLAGDGHPRPAGHLGTPRRAAGYRGRR